MNFSDDFLICHYVYKTDVFRKVKNLNFLTWYCPDFIRD